jgi:hypothetical protein
MPEDKTYNASMEDTTMAKKRAKSPAEPKTTTQHHKSRPGADTHFAVPRGLSISSSEAVNAKAYYASDQSFEGEQSSQWGGEGAALLGLSAKAAITTPATLKPGMPDPHSHIHVFGEELLHNLAKQSPEAIALAEIALAFCKECRGWKNAHRFNDWGYPFIVESVSKKLADTKIPPYERQFHYTHLDKVMAAVREWLSDMDAYEADAKYEEILSFRFGEYFVGAQDQTGVCHYLMAACVEAKSSGK